MITFLPALLSASVLSPSSNGTTTTSAVKIPSLSTILLAESIPDSLVDDDFFTPRFQMPHFP